MTDIPRVFDLAFDRVKTRLLKSIARDGLRVLNRVLQESGFGKSEFLQDYTVFAFVSVIGYF